MVPGDKLILWWEDSAHNEASTGEPQREACSVPTGMEETGKFFTSKGAAWI